MRFLGTACPGPTSSAWGPPAFSAFVQYCLQREGPLPPTASPCCLPWETDSAGKQFSLSQMSFQVDPILTRLTAVAGGGPGTSQHGGREGRAIPWTPGLQPL